MNFHFEAFDGAGNLVEGSLDAATEGEARNLIFSRGVTPYLVRAAQPTDVLFQDIKISWPRRTDDSQLARLARDLAVLLKAGVPLDATLRIAAATAEDERMRRLAADILDGVMSGGALPDVMDRMSAFRPEYVRIIQAGETSADYGDAMEELADLLDRRVEIRTRIRAAMAYPALLVALAATSLWVVLGLLIPAVTPIFLENGTPLPPIIAAMDAIRSHAVLILGIAAGCIAGLVLAVMLARRNPASQALLDRLYLSVPLFGPIARTREAARFTRTLASLIRAGVAPLQALEASLPLVRNMHTRSRLASAIADVRAGVSIGTAMSSSAALPPVAQQMIAVGEESGRLQDMLTRAAVILDRQEQTRTSRILAVMTPAITILVAGMVAAILLSVVGAILSINELALQ